MLRPRLFCLFLVCLSSYAWAGVIRHDVPDSEYLDLGQRPELEATGFLTADSPSGGFSCSATLIAADTVLTAGHCVEDATSLDFEVGGNVYAASFWAAHPAYNPTTLSNDIGIITLASEVTNVTPAERYRGSDELGQLAVTVGFGTTGNGLTGGDIFDGLKRAGTNVVDRIEGTVLVLDFDNPSDPSDSATGATNATPREIMIAPGDSGGGLYVLGESGEPLLAGVHSFGSDANAQGLLDILNGPEWEYGEVTGSTRVSAYNDDIDNFLAGQAFTGANRPSLAGNLPFPLVSLAAQTVPEPATSVTLLFGGLCVLMARSRRRHVN